MERGCFALARHTSLGLNKYTAKRKGLGFRVLGFRGQGFELHIANSKVPGIMSGFRGLWAWDELRRVANVPLEDVYSKYLGMFTCIQGSS